VTFSSNDEAVRSNNTSLPIKAAQLSSLLNSLTDVETSVAESIKARQALIAGLEKLVADNKASLAKDEQQSHNLQNRRTALTNEKDHVEQLIVRGSESTGAEGYEPPRPDAEPLTPPPVESITPVGSPNGQNGAEPEPEPLQISAKHANESNGTEQQPSAKKRKLNQIDEFAAFGDAIGNLDPDVEAMLAGN
jgi:regulator of Ty1 transposition protein 103